MSSPAVATASRRAASAQASIIAASYAMLLAGSNAAYPLLPVYRDSLGLDPFVLSLTFTLYVAVLVPVLFVLARPRFTRHAPALVLMGLSLIIPSDLLMAHAHEDSILMGRVLAGIAGGLGTGAASALVVAAIGTTGRAVTATGNTIGAILGVSGAQLTVVVLTVEAPQVVFLVHGALSFALLVAAAAVLWTRREPNQRVLSGLPETRSSARLGRSALPLVTSGTIAWTSISIAAVFGAPIFNELNMPSVQTLGPILLVCGSAAGQLLSPALARLAPWVSGTVTMAAGVGFILAGAYFRIDPVAIGGFVVIGAGIGVAYRAALVMLTRGADPARQGASASLYAAITYAVAALVVLAIGWIGNTTGLVPATIAALVLTGVLAMAALAFSPRLGATDAGSHQRLQ